MLPMIHVAAEDIRAVLFMEGAAILRETAGMLRKAAGGMIVEFLKDAQQDCTVVLDAMRWVESQ